MKRARTTKSQLTGGSGDVNPQYMVASLQIPGGNASAISGTPLPIPRLQQQNGKQLVMEFLQIEFCFSSSVPNTWGPPNGVDLALAITTNPNLPASLGALLQDPRAISLSTLQQLWVVSVQPPTNYIIPFEIPRLKTYDLTDNAGHGILVATDTIYFTGIALVPATIEVDFDARIMYRFKEVGLAEYVGIVQSQQ